jgi:hypothetical protein
MQIVELFGGEHGAILFYPAETAGAPGRCCWQDSETGGLRGGSASRIQTCAGAELLLARCSRSDPSSQTSAAERFRSKAELLFAAKRGDEFSFDVNLFDMRNPAIPYLVLAFAQLARDGLGPRRGRAEDFGVALERGR